MIKSSEIKQNVKELLKTRYEDLFVAGLIATLLTTFIKCGIEVRSTMMSNGEMFTTFYEYISINLGSQLPIYTRTITYFPIDIFILVLIILVFTNTIGTLTMVGYTRFMMLNLKKKTSWKEVFYYFKQDFKVQKNIVIVTFVYKVKLVLWFCLFIIPGVIKIYEYHFISYALVENPLMSIKEMSQYNKALTNKMKMNMFMFDLSFIGWLLLCALPLAAYIIHPYVRQCYTQYYEVLKQLKMQKDVIFN